MKRTHWITPIGILVTLFVLNVAASRGNLQAGCSSASSTLDVGYTLKSLKTVN